MIAHGRQRKSDHPAAMSGAATAPPVNWRRWALVAAAALGISASSINTYTLGLFIAPLQKNFGWGRAEIAFGLTISAACGTVLAPLIGLLVDRYGARRMGIVGATIYLGATALLSTVSSTLSYWAIWLVIAFGGVLVKPMVWVAPISAFFTERRGLAIALALSGTGLASGGAPILAEYLIRTQGWQIAYVGLAGTWAAATLPMLFLFFSDAPGANRNARQGDRSRLPGIDLRSGYRSSWFFKLAGATLLATLCVISLMVHFVPMLQGGGFSSRTAAQVAGTFGIASICGRIVTGLLFDRLRATSVGAVVLAFPCVACLLLLSGVTMSTAFAAAILLGIALGGELDVAAYLSTRYFGLRNYGSLFGAITSMLSLGTALGPLLAGYLYDRTGSYSLWLWMMIPASATASLLIASLGPYPDYPVPPPDAPPEDSIQSA